MSADGAMSSVRIFEFDDRGRLLATIKAGKATFGHNNAWELKDVKQRVSSERSTAAGERPEIQQQEPGRDVLADPAVQRHGLGRGAAQPGPHEPWTCSVHRHLRTTARARSYEILEFWRKVFYPLVTW